MLLYWAHFKYIKGDSCLQSLSFQSDRLASMLWQSCLWLADLWPWSNNLAFFLLKKAYSCTWMQDKSIESLTYAEEVCRAENPGHPSNIPFLRSLFCFTSWLNCLSKGFFHPFISKWVILKLSTSEPQNLLVSLGCFRFGRKHKDEFK